VTDLTRRGLLGGLAFTFGLGPPGASAASGGSSPVPEPAVPADPASSLSAADVEDLLALAEVIVEGRPLTAAQRAPLIEHLAIRAGQGGGYYLGLFRRTAGLLATLAGARFSTVDLQTRAALVARHRLGARTVRPGESLGPLPEAMEEARTRAVPDIVAAYYRSPAGWEAVGYTAFPGRCGDLDRYTRGDVQ